MRACILARLDELKAAGRKGISMRQASLRMGHRADYLHGFLHKGSPRKLGEDERAALAVYLDLPERALRPDATAPGPVDLAPDDAKLFAVLANRLDALYREERLAPNLGELAESAYRIHREVLRDCDHDLADYRRCLEARLTRLQNWLAEQRSNILRGAGE